MRQKVSCNTTINRNLLNEAKLLDIKLSEVFENALSIAVAKKRKEKWIAQNANAIAQHNKKLGNQAHFQK